MITYNMKSINNRQIAWSDSVMILKANIICVIVDLDDDKVALYPSMGISREKLFTLPSV